MSKLPPGPKDMFGGATIARWFRRSPLDFLSTLGREYGDICYFRAGPLRMYIVNQPQMIREVLVTKAKSFCRPPWLVGPLAQLDGQGLVLTEGELWARQRRLVQPSVSGKRFEGYSRTIVATTQRMLGRWQASTSCDASAEMTQLTLEIIGQMFFGVDLTERGSVLGEAVRTMSEVYMVEAGNPLNLPSWVPTPLNRRKQWAIRTLDEFVWKTLRERRAGGEDRGDLLSMLLLAVDDEGDGRGMSDTQARDEAMTMFNAGHDSTAATLSWIWYLIATNPEVEARLLEEVDTVLGGRDAMYADVSRLSYTDMVIKETLRLYPTTWALFAREAIAPVEIGGYPIQPGGWTGLNRAWVYVFPWITHRDPRYFDNPLKFDPERFSPGRSDNIQPFTYIPFGAGPRACIGAALASMEMVLIVATVLQRYRVRLAVDQGPVEPEPLIALRPKGGVRLALARRSEIARSERPAPATT